MKIILKATACLLSTAATLLLAVTCLAQDMVPRYYDMGSPTLADIWVDPVNGNDANTGAARSQALRTINAAWNAIPANTTMTATGYRIQLVSGTYPEGSLPVYWEGRYGTYQYPIVIQAADGAGTAILRQDLNIHDCRYLYLVDFAVTAGGNNIIHAEGCTNMLLHGLTLQGSTDTTQEVIKMNQCRNLYVEDSDVSGAYWMALDFVACQYGHIVGSRFHNADWVIYLKGGSAYFRVEANRIYDGGTCGFLAGMGTGFEFMSSPWLHYECSDVKFINNVIHDIEGAGMGVNGGYDILLAYNTLYRVGSRSHALEAVFGARSCDGDTARCSEYLAAGGWGTAATGVSESIPNRNVYFYNNIIYNPSGFQSAYTHLAVYGPRTPTAGSNIPSPAEADTNLRFRGNIFWNGTSAMPLGIGEEGQGGQASNPTCNPDQFRADNSVNTLQPELVNPAGNDLRPITSGNVFSAATFTIPDFTGGDRPSPPTETEGNLVNTVTRDFFGNTRAAGSPPGAYASEGSTNATTDPVPVVYANSMTGAVTIASSDTLSVTISLNPNASAGSNADWWLLAQAAGTWYYCDFISTGGAWLPGLSVSWQGPLFSLASTGVLSISGLNAGTFEIYFGVDTVMDGQITADHLFYSKVTVTVH